MIDSNLLSQITPKTRAIVWTEDNQTSIFQDQLQTFNYLFNGQLLNLQKGEMNVFETNQFNQKLLLCRVSQNDLDGFKNFIKIFLLSKKSDSKEIIFIGPKLSSHFEKIIKERLGQDFEIIHLN